MNIVIWEMTWRRKTTYRSLHCYELVSWHWVCHFISLDFHRRSWKGPQLWAKSWLHHNHLEPLLKIHIPTLCYSSVLVCRMGMYVCFLSKQPRWSWWASGLGNQCSRWSLLMLRDHEPAVALARFGWSWSWWGWGTARPLPGSVFGGPQGICRREARSGAFTHVTDSVLSFFSSYHRKAAGSRAPLV